MKNIHIPKSIVPHDNFREKNLNVISNSTSGILKQGDLEEFLNKNDKPSLTSFKLTPNKAGEEYLSISTDIHSILLNYPDLTNDQKLDYCNNQRYFMKLYLREVITKINKA
ncbi:MAG: hypothetical protein ACXAC5_13120 [Promethearchaeota archaeon]